MTAYAPHNLHPLADRFNFYVGLDECYRKLSANVGKMVVGDLNARLGNQLPGENLIIGPFTFGRRAVHLVEVPNRDLLLEFCESNSTLVANTCLPGTPEEKATYIEPGHTYLGAVSEQSHNMLDLFLWDSVTFGRCTDITNIRKAALGTDHYLIKSVFSFEPPETQKKKRSKANVESLADDCTRSAFANAFCGHLEARIEIRSVANFWENGRVAMAIAVSTLPAQPERANKPRISQTTLDLIARRRQARADNDCELERKLHKDVRASAKKDRSAWFDKLLQDDNWSHTSARTSV